VVKKVSLLKRFLTLISIKKIDVIDLRILLKGLNSINNIIISVNTDLDFAEMKILAMLSLHFDTILLKTALSSLSTRQKQEQKNILGVSLTKSDMMLYFFYFLLSLSFCCEL